jgi:hypothetical protein
MATFVDETPDGGELDITAPGERTELKKGCRLQNEEGLSPAECSVLRCGATTDFMEH